MVAINKPEPETLVRIGRYDSPLAVAVKKSFEKLEQTNLGLGNTVKYLTFNRENEPYLLTVAQQKNMAPDSITGHNTLLCVVSYSDKLNKDVADYFEEETGMQLNMDVPDYIKQTLKETSIEAFREFEEDPEGAMKFLRGFL